MAAVLVPGSIGWASGSGTSLPPAGIGWVLGAGAPPPPVSLSGVAVGVEVGTLGVDVVTTLTGVSVGVEVGSFVSDIITTLAGVAVGVDVGILSYAPAFSLVPLTGVAVGVDVGYLQPPPEIYEMAWTLPAYRALTIPSYLYIQYNDDDDLQAFVEAYNALSQELITWFVEINLPIYTGPLIVGALLDWVALGLYDQARPTLPSGRDRKLGPYNTLQFNSLAYNAQTTVQSTEFYATTDDVFKRIITWNFYKDDGRQFSVRWLKRRVMRFLLGENGAGGEVDQTYRVSVGFGADSQVDIRILAGLRSVTGGAVYNMHGFNDQPFNGLETVFQQYVPLEFAPIFKAAVDGGALQLPFQFDWIVTV